MHGLNFSFVPFVGETGEVNRRLRPIARPQGPRPFINERSTLSWYMSSQVKYGRDGNAYALHQLHRQPNSRAIPVSGRPTYVPPVLEARLDLRTVISPAESLHLRMHGEFVDRVERVLIHFDGRMLSDPAKVEEHSRILGLRISPGASLFGRHVKVMDQAWRKRAELDVVARTIVARHLSRQGGRIISRT